MIRYISGAMDFQISYINAHINDMISSQAVVIYLNSRMLYSHFGTQPIGSRLKCLLRRQSGISWFNFVVFFNVTNNY